MPKRTIAQIITRKSGTFRRTVRREGVVKGAAEFVEFFSAPLRKVVEDAVWRAGNIAPRTTINVQGHDFVVISDDPGISRELRLYGAHEPLTTKLAQAALKPGMNVIDIGANLGYYALLEARAIGEHGRVVAIEPVPENVAILRENIRLNGYHNVTVYEGAMADKSGFAEIMLSAKSNLHSLLPAPGASGKSVRVETWSVDDLVTRERLTRVDLIRMDLEGYEVVVIDGMLETLRNFRPMILMEVHPHIAGIDKISNLLRRYTDLGYGIHLSLDQSRDRPGRIWACEIEHPTLDKFLEDERFAMEARPFMFLLVHPDAGA